MSASSQKVRTRSRRIATPRKPGRRRWPWLVGLLVIGWLGYELWTLPSERELATLRTELPAETALMRVRKDQAAEAGRKLRLRRTPVRFDAISHEILVALIASEDARFFVHQGFDVKEAHAALRQTVSEGKRLRGASTLTQQLAKNLYLSESRSLLRKVKELWIATRLEQGLSKERILEIYLNSVEWGDGVFGIEAAARVHLRKSAGEVSLAEAAALVAMLPNPRRFGPHRPDELRRRARRVLDRIADEKLVKASEIELARQELDAWLGASNQKPSS